MNRNVVVVDRDLGEVERIVEALSNENYHAVAASDASDAIEKIMQEHPFLLIVGQYLPDMTGYEMVMRLPENARPPFFVLYPQGLLLGGNIGWEGLHPEALVTPPVRGVDIVVLTDRMFVALNSQQASGSSI